MADRSSITTIKPIKSGKIAKVMGEFKDGTLNSSSGKLVKNRKQAIAIALSEAKRSYEEEGFSFNPLPVKKAVDRLIEMIGEDDFKELEPEDILRIPKVILFTTGKYPQGDVSLDDLKKQAFAAKKLSNKRPPIIKITHDTYKEHVERSKDYPYAVGEVDPASICVEGECLIGDLSVFKWVVDDLYTGYLRSSSAEIKPNLEDQNGVVYPQVFDALSLLGSTRESQWEKLAHYKEFNSDEVKIYKYEEFNMPQEQDNMFQEMKTMYSEMVSFKEEMGKMKTDIQAVGGEMKSYAEALKTYMEQKPTPAPEEKDMTEDKKYEEYEEKIRALELEKQEGVRKYEEFENKTFVEKLIVDGKLLPKFQKTLVNILGNQSKDKVIMYSEDGTEKNVSPKEEFIGFLNELTTNIIYSEVGESGRKTEEQGEPKEETFEVTDFDRKTFDGFTDEEIIEHKKVKKYSEEQNVSYDQAFKFLFS